MKLVLPTDYLEDIKAAAVGRDTYDELLIQLIEKARNNGVSWQRIGESLGVTRQAATQRYRDLIDDPGPVRAQSWD